MPPSTVSEPFSPPLDRLRAGLLHAGRWCAVASLFAAPLNKPATNIAIGLSLLLSLLGTDVRPRWQAAVSQPVVRGALAWWVVLMLSALHAWYLTSQFPSLGTFVWACWYPLLFASLLTTRMWRHRAFIAFCLAVGLVMLVSYGMGAGLIPQRELVASVPAMRNTVFKEYTQQGLSTLIFAAMALAFGMDSPKRSVKATLYALALIAVANVVWMLESRTTYVTLIPLLVFWAWRLLAREQPTWKAFAGTCVLVPAAVAVLVSVPPVRERLLQSVSRETALYLNDHQPTATGIRLELWQHTVPIIESAPVFGHGLDQWEPLYLQTLSPARAGSGFVMGHPHQEMLLILAEQGAAGLLVYLALLGALAFYVLRLEPPERDFYISLLLVYLTAGLANCLWADFTHRHVFMLLLCCIPPAKTRPRALRTHAPG
ncbi:MAG TPA: O-antigen ligase family protein [Frateuria sp.]|uniref:O-antigen ligase family protein n=1 Tax=Frateuria sp. TaxID=2211372 RepID=UPI002D7FE5F0|nr:O-antigen ligase family protein [Frateuria sp.]HET6805783.1 O-antigen ligase family protein [Frateuria sp.]